MQGSNKFLFGIVIGIILLVIVTFSVVLLRPEPAYQADNTPEGAAHNYLLALQEGDYVRAYQYIPAAYRYPADADDLAADAQRDSWRFDVSGNASLSIESAERRGEDAAVVTVRKTTFYDDGLMGSHEYSQTFTMRLMLEAGRWKVSEAEEFWSNCWGTSQEYWCR